MKKFMIVGRIKIVLQFAMFFLKDNLQLLICIFKFLDMFLFKKKKKKSFLDIF